MGYLGFLTAAAGTNSINTCVLSSSSSCCPSPPPPPRHQRGAFSSSFSGVPSSSSIYVRSSASSRRRIHSSSIIPLILYTPASAGPPRAFLCRSKINKGSGSGSDIISELELGRPEERKVPNRRVNGIFWILLLNIGIYLADHIFQVREIKALYLYHSWPSWYQFVTSTFCHANWNHLSSNLFFLYIFGKLVEEEEGSFALWFSYILTGAGANLVSWLVLPRAAVSVGASGAVFGLFAISVLVKMSWDWRKILEVLILGQFVIDKVMEAAQASTGLVGPSMMGSSLHNVNHIAHLSGALIGAALVLLISRISFP